MKYSFEKIETCDMCGVPSSESDLVGQRLNCSQGYNPRSKSGISVSVFKCSSCGLLYSNPMPVPENIQDHYGVPAEDYWIPEYFNYDKNYFKPQVEDAKRLLDFQEGMKALDIGAGLGKSMLSLKYYGFDTYGFEPSVTFREKAITEMKVDESRLKLGMLEEVEYEDSFFDFITFGAVLEHLYHPAKSIEKAMKWLKPGGIMQIEVPSSKYLIPKIYNLYNRLRGTTYVSNLSPMHDPYHLYEFDLKSFQKHAEKLGYEIAYHYYEVCKIYFIPKVFHRLLKWYMAKTNTGMQLTVYLRKS